MNGIRDYMGGMVMNLNINRMVEALFRDSMGIKLGVVAILATIIVIFIIFIRNKKQKKNQKGDYRFFAWTLVYMIVALYVFATELYGIGNNVETIIYILILIEAPLFIFSKYKDEQQKRIINEKELAIYKEMLKAEKIYITKNKELYDNIRSMKHDMNDHIKMMENLMVNSKNEEGIEYFKAVKKKMEENYVRKDTGNSYIDMIFTEADKKAKEKGIRLMISCEGKIDELRDPLSVSVVLNNALNNAFEACDRIVENTRKVIDITLVCKRDIILVIKNSCNEVITVDGRLSTQKEYKESHGIGLKNIEAAVKALGGVMQWKYNLKEKQFTFMANWCQ